jgi:hypothetical protein
MFIKWQADRRADALLKLQTSILQLKEPDQRIWKILKEFVEGDKKCDMVDEDMFVSEGR